MSEPRSAYFWVQGIPRPKGSMVGFKHPNTGQIIMQPRNAKDLRAWAADIGHAAMQAWSGGPSLKAIHLSIAFNLPRPKSHFGTGRNAGKLKASAPSYPITKPDGDKLERAVWDALTGIVYRDDSQVVSWPGTKDYTLGPPGIRIEVREMMG